MAGSLQSRIVNGYSGIGYSGIDYSGIGYSGIGYYGTGYSCNLTVAAE
jgi:hypothetical protein